MPRASTDQRETMKMKASTKKILLIAGAGVAAYFVYTKFVQKPAAADAD